MTGATEERHTNIHVSADVREFAYSCVFVLDAQCAGPGALNSIHDGLDHFRGGALASQVSSVQLENKGGDARREKTRCEQNILYSLCNTTNSTNVFCANLFHPLINFFFCFAVTDFHFKSRVAGRTRVSVTVERMALRIMLA